MHLLQAQLQIDAERTGEAAVGRRRNHDIQPGALEDCVIDGGRVGRNLWVGWMDEGMGRVW